MFYEVWVMPKMLPNHCIGKKLSYVHIDKGSTGVG